jgi:hypothetical protein
MPISKYRRTLNPTMRAINSIRTPLRQHNVKRWDGYRPFYTAW